MNYHVLELEQTAPVWRAATIRVVACPRAGSFLEYNRLLARIQERQLAAIFVADAVSYSSLMGDRRGGHPWQIQIRPHQRHRAADQAPSRAHRQKNRRRRPGDLPSVVEAVGCGSRMQGCHPAEDETAAGWRPELHYRVGINLGDIIIEDDDVYGNDVNVAVRIEALSPPGGLALSGLAYWNVKGRTPLQFEELGFLRLKNIAEPIQVYQAANPEPVRSSARRLRRSIRTLARATAQQRTWSEDRSHQPEIVVLPFENLSSDPEQEYFCDGLTNDLTTDLSRFSNLFVIAANTAFSYKGQHPSHDRIRRELAVDYMVEGSVQRSGSQIRINAQLIDTRTGRHLWADRYKRGDRGAIRRSGRRLPQDRHGPGGQAFTCRTGPRQPQGNR